MPCKSIFFLFLTLSGIACTFRPNVSVCHNPGAETAIVSDYDASYLLFMDGRLTRIEEENFETRFQKCTALPWETNVAVTAPDGRVFLLKKCHPADAELAVPNPPYFFLEIRNARNILLWRIPTPRLIGFYRGSFNCLFHQNNTTSLFSFDGKRRVEQIRPGGLVATSQNTFYAIKDKEILLLDDDLNVLKNTEKYAFFLGDSGNSRYPCMDRESGKFVYLDGELNVAIPCAFAYAGRFEYNRAWVSHQDIHGAGYFIDRDGKKIFEYNNLGKSEEPRFRTDGTFCGEIADRKNHFIKKAGIFDLNGTFYPRDAPDFPCNYLKRAPKPVVFGDGTTIYLQKSADSPIQRIQLPLRFSVVCDSLTEVFSAPFHCIALGLSGGIRIP